MARRSGSGPPESERPALAGTGAFETNDRERPRDNRLRQQAQGAPGVIELPIADIRIGQRHRKELGDITGLARSINEDTMLQPIAVTAAGDLIFGERRLRAAQMLGWESIPAIVLDLDSIVRGEYAENANRKDFTLSEAVAIKRALEPREREAAKERQREHGRTAPGRLNTTENFSAVSGRALDKVALAVSKHRTTLAKAEAIVSAAAAEPERFGKLLVDMDRTGRANGVYKRLRVMQQAEQIRAEPPPLPGGTYRVIAADPPWPYEKRDKDPSNRATYDYPAMSIAAIRALPVPALAAADCILWLWVTNHHMEEAFGVVRAWGFEQKTILTWAKDRFGTGDWLRGQTEHCLMAVRGHPVVTLTNQSTLLHGPVRAHSQKPESFYALVEALCPASRYLELFARQERPGWDCWGSAVPYPRVVA